MDQPGALRRLIETATIDQHKTVLLCIAQVDGGNYIKEKCENTPKSEHAEKLFCGDNELRDQLKKAKQIQLYITNTPCSAPNQLCADKLVAFARAVAPVQVIIKCVHLYYIVDGGREQTYVDGLIALNGESNVTLDVIMEDDWQELRRHLGVNNADFGQMMKNAPKMKEEVFGRLSGVDTNIREYRQGQLRGVIKRK